MRLVLLVMIAIVAAWMPTSASAQTYTYRIVGYFNFQDTLGSAQVANPLLVEGTLTATVTGVDYQTRYNALSAVGTIVDSLGNTQAFSGASGTFFANPAGVQPTYGGFMLNTPTPTYIWFERSLAGIGPNQRGEQAVSRGFSIGIVPEPTTWLTAIAGFGAIGFAMRRRNTAASVRFA